MNDYIIANNLKALILPSQENIYDFFNIFDIVIMPSRVEPFGIVAVEAGMMKKPLIASDVDGLKGIIDNGINGYLFPSENVEALKAILSVLIKNSKLRNKFGRKLFKSNG